ncbi:2-hydroxychromene-2-carboxylate isomerase [Rhodovulum iodosum]|uniref:2-hydroxychromene-2-carboxylate isomerase n=1 Tax=Rhodovulum iodosum TaxID=68291 RepID=A0ABV3XQ10_9RHOB|nr:DsbA family protein [Rhodovulum robiginosum]RSK31310.1 2-hydroxychromene-2-carboxylate isomerase [Rhodovulum robiginosum]
MHKIDFWVSIGSTYSFLTVMRIGREAAARGVSVTWRPFNVRKLMMAQQNVPFAGKPAKLAYMWRDVARRAARHGLSAQVPVEYPIPELEKANLVATIGCDEGWGPDYIAETYRRWFHDNQPPGQAPNLTDSLIAVGQDPDRVVPLAEAPATRRVLNMVTAEAEALGLFGAPSFVADGELFWGDDRLEDALDWAAGARA